MLGHVCVTKIGNVLFYKVYRDCWLTQDGEYGIFRAYSPKSRKECVIAKNEKPVDLDTVNFPDFKLNRIMEYPVYPNARVAMKAICENLYNEEVK